MDQKAFQIRTVIKSGKHGKVSLCDSSDQKESLEVAIKSELIKSPKNPHSRPYREFFILKQLLMLTERPEYYANPRWIGFIQVLDWFKGKTDQIRITSTPTTPVKTPTKPVMPQTAKRPARDSILPDTVKQAPKTAPRPVGKGSRLSYLDENEDVGNLSNAVTAIELTPTKRQTRVSATPTPKRIVPRTPLLTTSANRQREIKLQEGNLVLERADATLYAMRADFSFAVWRDVLFQILYALYVAQTEYEFVHHDLHIQNVLLKRLKLVHVPDSSDVEANLGVFQIGGLKWYSRGPWIVKLSDFGLSRIKLVDGDGSVVYDLAQPLFEAFWPDRDVLKILDEFSRVKITRWLSRSDCVELGVKMSLLKDSWFVGPEEAISMDDLLSVLHPAEVTEKLAARLEEKQKSVKQIRSAIRKQALHLQTLLQHAFFAPMMEQPTNLWLFEGNVSDTACQTSPTRNFGVGNDGSFYETPATPDSPPPVVKKLSFSDATLEAAFVPNMDVQGENTANSHFLPVTVPLSKDSPITPPSTPPKDTPSHIDTTPRHSARRSARVAAHSADSPRKLVKPDPAALVHHIDPDVASLQAAHSEIAKLPTPTRTSSRKPRRNTLLPAELEASLNDGLGPVNRSLASLLIDPETKVQPPAPVLAVNYDPVPSRCLGEPMVLPMLDRLPVNCIEALRDYLVRRASRLEETRSKRKSNLSTFFVRNEAQIAEARVERLARKRRRRPVRRSLGNLRRKGDIVSIAASRPRRKSLSAPSEVKEAPVVNELVSVSSGVVEEVINAVENLAETSASLEAESAFLVKEPTGAEMEMVERSERVVVNEALFEPIPMLANALGLVTSPTAPRRSMRRRSSLSVAPLQAVVPNFSLASAAVEASEVPARPSNTPKLADPRTSSRLVKATPLPPVVRVKPKLVSAKAATSIAPAKASAAATKTNAGAKKASARPPTPMKLKTAPTASPSAATAAAAPPASSSAHTHAPKATTTSRAPSARVSTRLAAQSRF